jgi:hypothetical protein
VRGGPAEPAGGDNPIESGRPKGPVRALPHGEGALEP